MKQFISGMFLSLILASGFFYTGYYLRGQAVAQCDERMTVSDNGKVLGDMLQAMPVKKTKGGK